MSLSKSQIIKQMKNSCNNSKIGTDISLRTKWCIKPGFYSAQNLSVIWQSNTIPWYWPNKSDIIGTTCKYWGTAVNILL